MLSEIGNHQFNPANLTFLETHLSRKLTNFIIMAKKEKGPAPSNAVVWPKFPMDFHPKKTLLMPPSNRWDSPKSPKLSICTLIREKILRTTLRVFCLTGLRASIMAEVSRRCQSIQNLSRMMSIPNCIIKTITLFTKRTLPMKK